MIGILRPVNEIFLLSMLAARDGLALGRLLFAPAPDEDIENKALLVDRVPEPMLRAGDGDDDLIEVPLVAAARCTTADAVGELLAEFQPALAGSSHR